MVHWDSCQSFTPGRPGFFSLVYLDTKLHQILMWVLQSPPLGIWSALKQKGTKASWCVVKGWGGQRPLWRYWRMSLVVSFFSSYSSEVQNRNLSGCRGSELQRFGRKTTRDWNGTKVLKVRSGMCVGKDRSAREHVVLLALPFKGSCEIN